MSKISIDISKNQKKKLEKSLKQRGHTIHSWVSEQIEVTFEQTTDIDVDIAIPCGAGPQALEGVDWAFTNDKTSVFTHDIHPYPAKFIPQIPEHLIRALSKEGDVVLDPFSGSCTTATEASRLGRNSISIDANPLSAVIGHAKTAKLKKSDARELDGLSSHVLSYISTIKNIKYLRSSSSSKTIKIILEKYSEHIPEIPNEEKWFKVYVKAELAIIKGLISEMKSKSSIHIANVALSRIVIKVSNQDSETRYTAVKNNILPSETLSTYINSLEYVIKKVKLAMDEFKYSNSDFLLGDSRSKMLDLNENSVDLIVTSPPYANATDYHLYHRFRMFWLGFDPREMGKIEIGSHLKHQRNNSGYEEYEHDMFKTLEGMYRVLKPGKYAALVVGDSIFKEKVYKTHKIIVKNGIKIGFEHVKTIDRPLHETKRSFVKPGRRLRQEQIVIIKKPDINLKIIKSRSGYKLFDYEISLLKSEINSFFSSKSKVNRVDNKGVKVTSLNVASSKVELLKRLSFLHELELSDGEIIKTNNYVKESNSGSIRKNSTYFTHGLHSYKGKFYPQLASSLLNIVQSDRSCINVFDPFCGSGTTILESTLAGNISFGMDMNPIAINIARAKNEILTVSKRLVLKSFKTLENDIEDSNDVFHKDDEFPKELLDELYNWFPKKVVNKLNIILSKIRLFGNDKIVNYFEVLLSSVIRNISQQDPKDLRIRKRKEEIVDAPVFEIYLKLLKKEKKKLENYWVAADQGAVTIGTFKVGLLDNRDVRSYDSMGLKENCIDCIVTSPPYATALPYIDTDRLSILVINKLSSIERTEIERSLTGSREIKKAELNNLDNMILSGEMSLPNKVKKSIYHICTVNKDDSNAGFRKKNTAALLLRYFDDMKRVLGNSYRVLKPGATAFFVVGDSKTKLKDEWYQIRTSEFIVEIAKSIGFEASVFLDISVTNDNKVNSKNFIEKNSILQFKKPCG